MKKHTSQRAMTMVELVVVLGIVSILVLMILPSTARPRRSKVISQCVNNLKSVGISVRIFATDHGDKIPQQISTNEGGCAGIQDPEQAIVSFYRCLSNYSLPLPRVLICPADSRKAATNLESLRPENISYFVNWSGEAKLTNSLLAGDRNISQRPGWLVLKSPEPLPWQPYRNGKKPFLHGANGNVVLVDSTVLRVPIAEEFKKRQQEISGTVNRVVVP
jgi:prepilin-type N-terminal cleavage/methylation domain-containing protein